MNRWDQIRALVRDVGADIWGYVSSHVELMLLLGVIGLLGLLVWVFMKHLKKTEKERAMARAQVVAENRMMSDYLTNLLLHLYIKDRLTPERFDYWNRKLGLMLDLHDMVPRKRAEELKKRLKRERHSTDPEMMKLRKTKTTPIPDMGGDINKAMGQKEEDIMAAFSKNVPPKKAA